MRFQVSNLTYFKGLLLLALAANMSWGTAGQELNTTSLASSSETIRAGTGKSSQGASHVDEEAARARVRYLKAKYKLGISEKPKTAPQPAPAPEVSTRKSLLSGAAESILNKRCVSCHSENSGIGFFGNHAFTAAKAEKIKFRILDEGDAGHATHPQTRLTAPERHVLSAWLARGAEDWN